MNNSNQLTPHSVTNFEQSDQYRAEIHSLIVGGAHTYSKGDDQFPVRSPAAIVKGKHGRVWDLDGNEYVDCGLALSAISLGHAYEPVLAAVREQLELGAAFTRPADIERDLARDMLSILPGMERLKFAKNGSNVTSAAVRLARAFTGRDYVAFPKSHPFFSFDDWFIGSTLTRAGIPSASLKMSLRYDFNDPDSLARLFKEFPGQIACVITEPEEINPGPPDFLRAVQDITRANGAIFILDEMVTGFRAGFPGYYTEHGLTPDLTTWGKGIGNGFSFCALAGRADIMDLGGIKQESRPRVFLLSTTHGGEAHVLAAARSVINIYKSQDVIGRQRKFIAELTTGMRRHIAAHNLESYIEVWASSWRIVIITLDEHGKANSTLRTLFCQEMIGHGVLTQGAFLPCFTHTDADIAQILFAFDRACSALSHAIRHGIEDLLVGSATRPVFRKYNGCLEICPNTPCPNEQKCKGK